VKADVLIIGGGLMGFSTAVHLAMRHTRCIVLDKDSPGRHASGVNAGGLRQLNRHPAEIPLSVAAAGMWRHIRELVDSDCDTRFPGQLRVAENATELESLEERAALLRSMGYRHEEMIGTDELYRLVPALAPHCTGALICRQDGYGRPFHALDAFRRKARSLGVRYQANTRVDGVLRVADEWLASTVQGEFRAPVLVNCAGAWANHIATLLGEPVPLKPGAPMMMVSERLPHFIDPVIGAAGRKLSFKQMQNGTLLIGGAHLAELDLTRGRTEMNWHKLAISARSVMTLFPQLKDVRIVRSWAGLEAFMPDNIPVIGASVTASGAYHAFGFSAHGFQLSPVVGRILSQLILDGSSELPIEPFRIDRFRQVCRNSSAVLP
jgi:sarcosine oxidase, subunit beta